MNKSSAFGMLEVLQLPPKPRKNCMILMSEVGIPLRANRRYSSRSPRPLSTTRRSPTMLGLSDRLSAAWIKKKVALYNEANIEVVPGGIPFQLAVIQHKVDDYLKAVRDLGFAGVEMSEDTMQPLATGYREELIAQALGMGLKVMTEMGRKNVDIPFDADEVCKQILRDIELGVSKIYLESSEIQAMTRTDPKALDTIAALGRNEYLLFELGLIEPQEKAAWLVERYGFEINFASVSPADVVAVDAIRRRGMHRKSHYSFMAGKGA